MQEDAHLKNRLQFLYQYDQPEFHTVFSIHIRDAYTHLVYVCWLKLVNIVIVRTSVPGILNLSFQMLLVPGKR